MLEHFHFGLKIGQLLSTRLREWSFITLDSELRETCIERQLRRNIVHNIYLCAML